MADITRREFIKNVTASAAAVSVAAALLRPAAAEVQVIRPPGAVEEDEFLSRCIRCARCSDACPSQAIVMFTEANGKKF